MRAKNKLVVFALSALLIAGFASTAQAQVSHAVASTPVDVIQTGLAEVLGEVRLQKSTIPSPTTQTTIGGTLNVLYVGVPIVNTFAGILGISLAGGVGTIANVGGITINFGADYANDAGISNLITAQVSNTAAGGLVTISFPAGIVLTADGATITINGVRATVTGVAVGGDVNASIQALPSNAHSFVNVSTVRVARANQGLIVGVTGVTDPICITPINPTVVATEGFPGAFVQHVTTTGGLGTPANARNAALHGYGGTANTQIHIVVANLPANVTLSWPTAATPILASSGTGRLVLVAVSGTGNTDVTYDFNTLDQSVSDQNTSIFNITPIVTIPATSGFGQSVAWAQLTPVDTTAKLQPRFNDPFQPNPAANFINVSKCVTYLLFPFMSNAAGSTFDSGMAIANTSADDAAFGGTGTGAIAQSGSVTLYGWTQFTPGGTAPAVISQTVVSSLEAGNTWAGSLSGITGFAGFQGYIIAVCQFQYGHGFAFLSGTYGSSAPIVAEGYLALVIPDPNVAVGRNAGPPVPGQLAGENLGN